LKDGVSPNGQEKSKTYIAEFRKFAIKLANESDKPIAQISKGSNGCYLRMLSLDTLDSYE